MILTRLRVQSIALQGRRAYSEARGYAMSNSIPTVKLAYSKHDPPNGVVPKEEPIVFLHGLFGSKVNNRTVSKVLARDLARSVYCLDLRNHGESPHHHRHDYPSLAADVEQFLDDHEIPSSVVIGHSMGAKTAMALALRRPELVSTLIPVDNAPVDARLASSFGLYVRAMKEIEQAGVTSTKQAYQIMDKYEKSVPIQQFLLSNLRKDEDGIYRFRVPIDILGKSLDQMADFPYLPDESRYVRPTLFIRGTNSHYVTDDAYPAIGQFFPLFTLKDVESGHWVISENPQEFLRVTKEFLVRD
ncbi:probable alcohol acetyltransferase [Trichomonascus vanleenenianus]|uniref:putative alcohol acetyltransferase n=1 Tax=Trichomonascus vanleenenianus TaxID=2268995 RepID=UPI003EC9999A